MRGLTKILALVAAVATVAACGSDKASPEHSFSTLTGKTTTIALSAKFVTGLAGLGVAPTPLGKATIAIPNITFPVTGGHLDIYKQGDATPQVQGEVDAKHSGLQLTVGKGKNKKTVALKNFVIDPGASVKADLFINGRLFARQGPLFDLDEKGMAPPEISDAGAATLSGIKVLLSDDAAAALNTALNLKGKKKVAGGLLVGTATIEATGKS